MFLFTFIFMFHGVTELEIFLLRVSRDILREVGGSNILWPRNGMEVEVHFKRWWL